VARGFENQEFICVDCETTGLDIDQDRIIEVACVRFDMQTVLEQYETLVNPEIEIPPTTTAIHHITNSMVQNQPLIQDVLPKILTFIGRGVLIGHGIKFDVDMLAKAAERAEIPCTISNNPSIDTLRMARLYGDSPCNSLEDLGKHFNIGTEGAHRAMNDVMMNVEVFRQLAKKYQNLKQIENVLSRPIKMKTMPLGKHKGRSFRDIPINYLYWALKKEFDQDLMFSIREELKRRKTGNLFSQSSNPFKDLY
jgi:DNA polymerase-3 subunit epsilon